MQSATYFRELREQFQALSDSDSLRDPLCASEGPTGHYEPLGGPDSEVERRVLHQRFRSLATRGGLGLATGDLEPFDEWLKMLQTRSPRSGTFHESTAEGGPAARQNIPVTLLHAPDDISGVCQEDRDSAAILVEPTADGRFAVVAGHVKYAAIGVNRKKRKKGAGKNRVDTVTCLVRDPALTRTIQRDVGDIERVLRASMELCELLETEALVEQHRIPSGVTKSAATSDPVFPCSPTPSGPLRNRAEWLRGQMRDRGLLTKNSVAEACDIGRKTVDKILNGYELKREDVLERLAAGLSKSGGPETPKLSPRDIPEN